MKNKVILKILLTVVLGALALAALSADSSCWKPPRPNCPGGVSSENGRGCGANSLTEVSNETIRSQDNVCDSHSKNCQHPDRKCNVLRRMDALWRRVYCVNQETGYRKPLGWCIDSVFSYTATGKDCSGKRCVKPAEEINPIH